MDENQQGGALYGEHQCDVQYLQEPVAEPDLERILPQAEGSRNPLFGDQLRDGRGQARIRHQPLLLCAQHVAHARSQGVLYAQLRPVQHPARTRQQLHRPVGSRDQVPGRVEMVARGGPGSGRSGCREVSASVQEHNITEASNQRSPIGPSSRRPSGTATRICIRIRTILMPYRFRSCRAAVSSNGPTTR